MNDTPIHDDRDSIIRVLSRLPANASLEDIRYEFETIFAILESLRDRAAGGPTYSHAEVMEMVRQCRLKSAGRPAPVTT